MKRPSFLLGFWRDRRGVSAIEFALIAPFLIVLYMGMAELSQAMSAQRRASHAAAAVGDLITQSDTITVANVDDVLNAATVIMKPFAPGSLKLRITSVTADSNGNPKAEWSRGKNGLVAYANGAGVTVPAGLVSEGENLLIAEAAYTYTSPVTTLMPKPMTFNEKFFLKARKGSKVVCTGC